MFVALVVVLRVHWVLPFWVIDLSLVVSAITYGGSERDKHAAAALTWRSPERSPVLLGLIGGSPGAICAQQRLRHELRSARDGI